MPWTDVHTHFHMLDIDIETALSQAESKGVKRFINIGTCPEDHEKVLSIAQKYYPKVTCTLGIHPHHAKDYNQKIEDFIKEKRQKEVIAIGEIGLDFYYEHSPKSTQYEVFKRQMQLAHDLKLPVEIHTREAESETKNILKEFRGKVSGLLHCFTGSYELATYALDMGFDISISGIITFKKSNDLCDTVRRLPKDRIHLETDAPYLAPVPMRGKKNEPAFLIHTAKKVAELLQINVNELMKQTEQNASRLFKWTVDF